MWDASRPGDDSPPPAASPAHARWRALLETATLAPSPHNVQPWRLRVRDATCAELLIERARTLPDEDVEGSFIVLTMGLFVESLRIVAAHEGLGLEDALLLPFESFRADALRRRTEALVPFAELRLRPAADPGEPPPLALFHERRTSRLGFRDEPLAAGDEARLAALAAAWGQHLEVVRDAARIERLLRWNADAVFEDLNHPPYRDELRGWMRYGERASARHRDGLDARCMNQHPAELWLAFHASPMLRMPGLRAWFRRRYRRQIGTVRALALLSGPFWAPADAYASGRFLIRFWLECTRLGLYLHPYGNLVTNRPTAARVESEIGRGGIWLVFKLGHSAVPPRSRRRSVDQVLVP